MLEALAIAVTGGIGLAVGFLCGVDAAGLFFAEEWDRRHPGEVELTPRERGMKVVIEWGRRIAAMQYLAEPYRGRHR